jgi:hypothetical protein
MIGGTNSTAIDRRRAARSHLPFGKTRSILMAMHNMTRERPPRDVLMVFMDEIL